MMRLIIKASYILFCVIGLMACTAPSGAEAKGGVSPGLKSSKSESSKKSSFSLKQELINLRKHALADQNNYLIRNQTRLNIPANWYFRRPKKKSIKNDNIHEFRAFEFLDGKNNIFGVFDYTSLKKVKKVSATKLANYYATKLSPGFKDKTIHPTFIDERQSFIIKQTHIKKGFDSIVALVPEGNAFNKIHILSDPGYIRANEDMALRVLASYSFEPEGYSERFIRNCISFKCYSGGWVWYDDWRLQDIVGYILINRKSHQTPISLVGVGTTKVSSVQGLESLVLGLKQTLIIPEFSVKMKFGDCYCLGTGLVAKTKSGKTAIYYLLKSFPRNHLVLVNYNQGLTVFEPQEIHEKWDVFTNLLDEHLSLPVTIKTLDPK